MPARLMVVIFGICFLLLGVLWFFSPLRNSIPGIPTTTRLPEKNFASNENVSIALQGVQVKKTEAKLTRFDGKVAGATINSLQKDNNAVFTIEKPIAFQPGKYTFTVTTSDKKTYVQDFTWGVLAINTNKSVYLPQETAKISLAVLDEEGMMVCDADVVLRIKYQLSGSTQELTTKSRQIRVNPECKVKNYTERPDYEATYQVGNVGSYTMDLTATTRNGTYTISDSFQVKDSVPFDVERVSATRIYPTSKYPVVLNITANRDFDGEITERVPYVFDISKTDGKEHIIPRQLSELYQQKELTWQVRLKKGEQKTLSYTYDAPDVSPYFFLLGPLSFYENEKKVFAEERYWQIAVDAVPTAVEQQVNMQDQTLTTTSQSLTPTDNSMGLIKYDGTKYSGEMAYFEADMKKIENRIGASVGSYNAISCPSSTDCKMAYYNALDGSLRFFDCDDATCSTGTATIVDGAAACSVTNCNISDDVGQYVSLDCTTGASDCKIAYYDNTNGDLLFVDCDDSTCSTGTRTLLDGNTGCSLTNCSISKNTGNYISLKCPTAANCKIAYQDVTNTDLDFADCDTATCSSGTVSLLDGNNGCVLTGCTTGGNNSGLYNSLSCPASDDCKIAYYTSSTVDLLFADCANETCSSGTRTLVDGNTGCTLTNCTNSAVGQYPALYCLSSTDCKIAYALVGSGVRFADCDDAACTTGTVTQNVDGTAGCKLTGCATSGQPGLNIAMYCPTATDCKMIYGQGVINHVYFADCDDAQCSTGTRTSIDYVSSCTLTGCSSSSGGGVGSIDCSSGTTTCAFSYGVSSLLNFGVCSTATCSSGTATRVDGNGAGYQDIGSYHAIACPTSSTCKIAYYNTTDTSLKFMSCTTSTCSSNTIVTLDGASGCVITNCSTSTDVGKYVSLTCPSESNCKIAYYDNTNSDLLFIDCDAKTCNTGTLSLLDGNTGCTLTGCATGANSSGQYTSVQCPASNDCKISFYNVTSHALKFADCDSETCGSGTVTVLDGNTGCTLTSCSTSDTSGQHTSMYCISGTDCKIAYYNSTNTDLYFADCDDQTCSTGSRTLVDGNTGCTLTNCATTSDAGSLDGGIDCSAGASSCVLSYLGGSATRLGFCADATCSTGTSTNLDGNTGCVITSCDTTAGYTSSKVDCSAGMSDCKVYYLDSVHQSAFFIDCNAASCTSGTRSKLEGASCALTGCTTNAISTSVALTCIAGAAACQTLAYDSINGNLVMAQCSNASCSSGTSSTIAGDLEYVTAMLYTSGGSPVADAIVTSNAQSYSRLRSAALSLVDGTSYTPRFAVSETNSNLSGALRAARLVIPQAGSSITDTETQIELGNNETTTSSSYAQLSSPKIYLWNSAKFGGTTTVNFEATMKGSAGGVIASAALSSDSTCSTTVPGSDVSVTGTTWTLARTASPITLTDNTEYFVCLKTSSGTGSVATAKLIIDQTDTAGIQAMELVHQYLNTSATDTDSTYTSQNYLNQLTKTNMVGDVMNYYFETTMKTSSGTGYAQLYDSSDASAVSGSELSTTSTTYTRKRSSELGAVLTTAKDYDIQLKNAATNTTSVSNAWMIVDVAAKLIQPKMEGPIRIKGNTRIK